MAKTKKESSKSSKDKNQFKGFANFYLTASDKETIKGLAADEARGVDRLSDYIEEGYAFKFGWDHKAGCIVIMMIGEFTSEFNQGWIMTARHNDIWVAITAVIYQHEVLAGEQQWDTNSDEMFTNNW